jgi:putative endonuclease
MQDDRRALGAEGEARAAAFLARKGYRIVERNVRSGGVEMDIVASRGALVIFVEVKTRRSTRRGPPEAAVDVAKQRRLARGAAAWLRAHPTSARRVRFDVISCRAPASSAAPWRIDHIESAFDAGS